MTPTEPRIRLSRRPLVLIAAGHLILEVCNNGLPVVYPLLVGAGQLTFTQVGLITLVASLSAALGQPLLGYVSDRWDPRLLISGGIALSGVSMGLTGLAPGYVSMLILVALAMLGSAAFHPAGASLSSASSWAGRRGAAVAVFSVGGNVGGALSPLLLTAGIAWMGFRGTWIVIPVGLIGSLLLWRQLRSVTIAPRARAAASDAPVRRGSIAGLIAIVLAVMFRTWFQISLGTYLPSWIESQGGSLELAGQVLFVVGVATGLGSLVGGALSDRTGRWPLMAVSLGLVAPLVLLLGSAPAALQTVQIAALGFLVGSTFPVAIVAAQETWPGGHGLASGLTMGLTWVGGGIGAFVTGSLADRFSLDLALRWLWVPAALATLCILAYPLLTRCTKANEPLAHPGERPAGESRAA